jgi:hypothetical protein
MLNMIKFRPDGWHTVTPRIVVRDPEKPDPISEGRFPRAGRIPKRLTWVLTSCAVQHRLPGSSRDC